MIQRGEIRWYTFAAPNKRRPVLLLTRDAVERDNRRSRYANHPGAFEGGVAVTGRRHAHDLCAELRSRRCRPALPSWSSPDHAARSALARGRERTSRCLRLRAAWRWLTHYAPLHPDLADNRWPGVVDHEAQVADQFQPPQVVAICGHLGGEAPGESGFTATRGRRRSAPANRERSIRPRRGAALPATDLFRP